MPDDVAACRDAGMDDVLAKPSALPTVQRVLAHLGGSDGGDCEPLLSRSGRARRRSTTARRSTACSCAPSWTATPALEAGDAGGIPHRERQGGRGAARRAGAPRLQPPSATPSHRMKGLARLVAASSLAAVCERLERQARDGCVDEPGVVLAEFEREWHRVSDFLNAATPT